ncbi:putative disease resistance protein [Vitis vinifera]|uniref:Putative disease resistance protein n=1 Tax=Vitis vinifera TaxID=29760 RepID=A0A438GKR7_VITVI|nr:putative disease resistance protein [Vitis vinifera]
MDCVSPILDVVTRLWDCTAKHAVSIRDLQQNMDSLRNAMQELRDVHDDVNRRVELMEKEVNEILQKGDQEIQKKCIGTSCPRNCRSRYKLGKKASEMFGALTDLRNKGRFDVVADSLPQAPVDERPLEKTVGLDLMYAEVCRCIQDEQLGIIGLYGMGGAGKTTLMTKVNNEFIRASKDFEIAIWVVVSRPASVGKVQEVIRNKLDIPDNRWRDRAGYEKAVEIFNVLKAKRFVMLLDDVWERLDLHKVGVPPPDSQNKSKVILTTRSLDVCRDMEAQKSIKVECLTEQEAMNLFKEKVGETTLNSHPDIPQFAEIAAKECKGLPLALVTIGRAMARKNTPQEWERAIQMLKTYPSKFSGMGDHVFPILKFSYDNLLDDTIKACFLYLAIFREDYEIRDDDLIFLWIGEGFLDECDNIDEAFNQGHDMIEHLKTACLFESSDEYYHKVKMHDVIRDMALWLSTTYSGNKNKILVEENNTVKAHRISKWKEAQRISFWTKSPLELTVPLYFPKLLTLIVRSKSGTMITELPTGIGNLVTLEYLNLTGALSFQKLLSSQKLQNVMRGLGLGKLEGMTSLQLPRMKHLDNLKICECRELQKIEVDLEKEGGQGFVADYMPDSNFYSLREVNIDQLPKLLDLTWIIYIPSLEQLFVHECESMEEVIGDASGVPQNLGIFSRLKGLNLHNLPNLRSISRRALSFPSLRYLQVRECPNLRKLPLDSNSARNSLKSIRGESKWWQGLQWEDETIQLTFTPYFK